MKTGDRVSIELFNHNQSENFRDPCTVTRVEESESESGFMVTIRTACDVELTLDKNWLTCYSNNHPTTP